MKSGVLFLAALLFSTFTFTTKAQAKDLLADSCTTGGPVIQTASLSPAELRNLQFAAAYTDVDMYSGQEIAFQMPKLTCDQLRAAQDAVTMVSIALIPPTTALKLPGVGAELAAGIAATGISAPAVAGVMVLSSVGVAVYYLVLKVKIDECQKQDQADFKRDLFRELETKYGIHSVPTQQIQYQK